MKIPSPFLIVIVLAWAAPAMALDVYLNGVLITGVRNQEFENATVTLDGDGNVRILAPQYRVERNDSTDRGPEGSEVTTTRGEIVNANSSSQQQKPDPPSQRSGSRLTRRYWLVAEVNGAGMVQYQIEVRINGRLVRSFSDAEAPAPVEITEYLNAGRNSVRVTANKITEGGRRSESSRHWMRVVLADGHIEGTAVVIDRPGVIFTRNAAQTDRESREYVLNAE